MNVLLFGATGMVGQGVLRECLLDRDVTKVVLIVRKPTELRHAKLSEIVHQDFQDFTDIEKQLTGFDACFFCLGVSSAGMKEDDYRRVTYGITMAAARPLVKLNPKMTFIFVSGAGSDSSERGRTMWARVKGQAENAVLALPCRAVYVFRPGVIVPMHGIESRTALYRIPYKLMGPVLPALKKLFPKQVTSTEQIGRAMLKLAKQGPGKRILESAEINAVVNPAVRKR